MGEKYCVLIWCLRSLGATTDDQKGTQFMISLIKPSQLTNDIIVVITADDVTSVTVTAPSINMAQTRVLAEGETWQVPLPSSIRYTTPFSIVDIGVKVEADNKVTVYVVDVGDRVSSGYLALPYHVLSTSYVAVTYGDKTLRAGTYAYPVILVLGLSAATFVTITLRGADCGSYTAGQTITFNLDEFDVYGIDCEHDFTGTQISSNKPVAVISGHGRIIVDPAGSGSDSLQEMLLPVEHLGTDYVLIGHIGRPMGSLNRIVATVDGTMVMSSSGQEYFLDAYDHVDVDTDVAGQQCITSNHPILVVAFGKGFTSTPQGDGFMSFVPSTDMFVDDVEINLDLAGMLGMAQFTNVAVVVDREESPLTASGTTVHQSISNCRYDVYTYQVNAWPFELDTGQVKVQALLYSTHGDKKDGVGFPVAFEIENEDLSSSQIVASSSQEADVSTNAAVPSPTSDIQLLTTYDNPSVFSGVTEYVTGTTVPQAMDTYYDTSVSEGLSPSVSPTIDQETSSDLSSMTGNFQYTSFVSSSEQLSLEQTFSVHFSVSDILSLSANPAVVTLSTSLEPLSSSMQTTPSMEPSSSFIQTTGPLESFSASIQTTALEEPSSASTQTTELVESSIIVIQTTAPIESSSESVQTSESVEPSTSYVLTTASTVTGSSSHLVSGYRNHGNCFCPQDVNIAVLGIGGNRGIRGDLLLDKWSLSKTRRKLTSASDQRVTAVRLGYCGITFLVSVCLVLILSDLANCVYSCSRIERSRWLHRFR